MGCNFYTLKNTHIGKRSAAGLYCWDCDLTLCYGGKNNVHGGYNQWYRKCPECGKLPEKETLENSSAGRELGFNKNPFKKKVGVQSCSSFTWAINKAKLNRIKYIKDEYGRKYTIAEFFEMLDECPIQFKNMIGKEFS